MFGKNEKMKSLLKGSTINRMKIFVERMTEIKNSSFDRIGKKFNDSNSRPKKFNTSILPLVSLGPTNFSHTIQNSIKSKMHTKSYGMINDKIDENMRKIVKVTKKSSLSNRELYNPFAFSNNPIPRIEKKNELSESLFNMNAKNNIKFNLVLNQKLISNKGTNKNEIRNSFESEEDLLVESRPLKIKFAINSQLPYKSTEYSSIGPKVNNQNKIKKVKINKNSRLNSIIESGILNNYVHVRKTEIIGGNYHSTDTAKNVNKIR